jgi:hypothetical protein
MTENTEMVLLPASLALIADLRAVAMSSFGAQDTIAARFCDTLWHTFVMTHSNRLISHVPRHQH